MPLEVDIVLGTGEGVRGTLYMVVLLEKLYLVLVMALRDMMVVFLEKLS